MGEIISREGMQWKGRNTAHEIQWRIKITLYIIHSIFPTFPIISLLYPTSCHLATHTTTLTSNSGILTMAIVAATKRVQWTFNEVPLTASTANIVHVNGSSTSTKVSIAKGHCIWLYQTYHIRNILSYIKCACSPWLEYPSCRHTTVASALPQESSHTVPHKLSTQISTLPSFVMLPPASRSWPFVHGAVVKKLNQLCIFCNLKKLITELPSQPTPASAVWRQLWDRIGLLEHSSSWLELELHWTSSRKIGPLPAPKWASLYALPPAHMDTCRIWRQVGPGRLCQHNFKHNRLSILVRIMLE